MKVKNAVALLVYADENMFDAVDVVTDVIRFADDTDVYDGMVTVEVVVSIGHRQMIIVVVEFVLQ
jgi:hypothetical protein